MFSPGGEEASGSIPCHAIAASRPEPKLVDEVLSPSIQRTGGDRIPAFELKFLISAALAGEVETWAARWMQFDAYCDPRRGGSYQTTTLYLDTAAHDVFHRAPGHRRRKYRLRRYGQEPLVYLECKSRRGDRVRKRRNDVPLGDLPALLSQPREETRPDAWFHERVQASGFRPACRITYERTAFVKSADDGPLRLTLDRRIRGRAESGWDLTPLDEGHDILAEHVVCECKFRGALPNLFKEVIQRLELAAGSVSKYRRMMVAAGVIRDEDGAHA